MPSLVPVLLVVVWCSVAFATLPAGYILQVTPSCGTLDAKGAVVNLITDIRFRVFAECDGSTQPVITSDHVHFVLPVGYPGVGSQTCVFKQKNGTHVYFVNLKVSYGEAEDREDKEFKVTCTFEPNKTMDAENLIVGEGFVTPVEVRPEVKGDNSDLAISLRILNDKGDDVSKGNVAVGKRVQLQAWATGFGDKERGLRPVSCYAVGDGKNERYELIKKGCGDGIILGETTGFLTDGMTSTSPYFDAFRFHNGDIVHFECNFTICSTPCDGDSCELGDVTRFRRSRLNAEEFLRAASSKIKVSRPISAHNKTLGKIVFVKKSKPAEPTMPSVTNPYFIVPLSVLGALALLSFIIATCACVRRDYSQLYELNSSKEEVFGNDSAIPTYDAPISIISRERFVATNSSFKKACGCPRNSASLGAADGCVACCDKALCDSLHLCKDSSLEPRLCAGDCVVPCNKEAGGRCDESCTNECNK